MAEQSIIYHNRDGVRRSIVFDRDTPEVFHQKTQVDCTQLVDNNRALEELHDRRSTNKLLARVPMTIYEQSLREDWDEGDWRKWLNDPDNVHFRVWKGRV